MTRSFMFSYFILILSEILHTSMGVFTPMKQCNSTNHPSIRQLTGVLFISSESNETEYSFSVCGLQSEPNDTLTVDFNHKIPMLVQRSLIGSGSLKTLAYMNNESVDFIPKGRIGYLNLSSSVPNCVVLLSLQCGIQTGIVPILNKDEPNVPCIHLFELYHQRLCSPVFRLRIWAIIAVCLSTFFILYCVVGLTYQRALRKRSWHDSIPHVALLDRLGSRLSNPLKRLRSRRFRYPQTQYIRIPVTTEPDSNGTNAPKESTPFYRGSDPIVNEQDPQDDLLLAL